MADSALLKMFKALEGVTFSQRIHGAMIKQAHFITQIEAPDATDLAFAVKVLDDPLRMWQPMLVECAANGTIQANLDIDPSGNIDDREVPDSDIEYVVGFAWHKTSVKIIQPTVE